MDALGSAGAHASAFHQPLDRLFQPRRHVVGRSAGAVPPPIASGRSAPPAARGPAAGPSAAPRRRGPPRTSRPSRPCARCWASRTGNRPGNCTAATPAARRPGRPAPAAVPPGRPSRRPRRPAGAAQRLDAQRHRLGRRRLLQMLGLQPLQQRLRQPGDARRQVAFALADAAEFLLLLDRQQHLAELDDALVQRRPRPRLPEQALLQLRDGRLQLRRHVVQVAIADGGRHHPDAPADWAFSSSRWAVRAMNATPSSSGVRRSLRW